MTRTPKGPGRGEGSTAVGATPSYRLVSDDTGLFDLVNELKGVDAYALDTEFHRERTYFPHLALVQLAWGDEIVLVDPLAVDFSPFAEVLDSDALAVIHASDQDLEVLDHICGATPRRLFDTQLAAGFLGMSTPSLATLVERLLGIRLEKGDQLTDWTRRPLTSGQLAYAATDVIYLLEIRNILGRRLERLGRLGWAEAECALLLERSHQPVVPEEAWWRIKHARQLRPKERAVAQSVAAWRERRAQRVDLPTRFVLSDLALVAIAHRPPSTRAELEAVRNLDGRHLQNGVDLELLQAIRAGLELAPGEVHMPLGPSPEVVAKPAAALGAAWVAERARAIGIDTTLLATRADLAAFFREKPEGRLVTSWRKELVGEPLRRLAEGELALAVDAGGGLVLEERSGRSVAPEATPIERSSEA